MTFNKMLTEQRKLNAFHCGIVCTNKVNVKPVANMFFFFSLFLPKVPSTIYSAEPVSIVNR